MWSVAACLVALPGQISNMRECKSQHALSWGKAFCLHDTSFSELHTPSPCSFTLAFFGRCHVFPWPSQMKWKEPWRQGRYRTLSCYHMCFSCYTGHIEQVQHLKLAFHERVWNVAAIMIKSALKKTHQNPHFSIILRVTFLNAPLWTVPLAFLVNVCGLGLPFDTSFLIQNVI